jgi:RNA polymerase sigma-70 factor (ECF subfamily)
LEQLQHPDDEVQRADRVGSGDRGDTVARLYDQHADAVFRYCILALGSAADAEDAVSETFARLIRSRRRRAAPAALPGDPDRAWVFGIARNVIREQLRYRRRHPTELADVTMTADTTQPSLDDIASDREELRVLREAMQGLREEYRQVLLLRFAAGLTSEETGQVLGKSAGAVRIQQLRALEQLKDRLSPMLGMT